MISIQKIDEWYYDLNETEKFDIIDTISPDMLDDDFWEHLTDDLKRNIYKGGGE